MVPATVPDETGGCPHAGAASATLSSVTVGAPMGAGVGCGLTEGLIAKWVLPASGEARKPRPRRPAYEFFQSLPSFTAPAPPVSRAPRTLAVRFFTARGSMALRRWFRLALLVRVLQGQIFCLSPMRCLAGLRNQPKPKRPSPRRKPLSGCDQTAKGIGNSARRIRRCRQRFSFLHPPPGGSRSACQG